MYELYSALHKNYLRASYKIKKSVDQKKRKTVENFKYNPTQFIQLFQLRTL